MQIGFSKKISEHLLDDIISIIINNLKKNKKIKITNFGTFIVRSKNSRIGRNPKTKEEAIIQPRKVVKFYPSLSIKQKLNSL